MPATATPSRTLRVIRRDASENYSECRVSVTDRDTVSVYTVRKTAACVEVQRPAMYGNAGEKRTIVCTAMGTPQKCSCQPPVKGKRKQKSCLHLDLTRRLIDLGKM
jgi:hypothetical protein